MIRMNYADEPGPAERPARAALHQLPDRAAFERLVGQGDGDHHAVRTTKEKTASAAKAADFSSDEQIGPYLRSLILDHHDSLMSAVR